MVNAGRILERREREEPGYFFLLLYASCGISSIGYTSSKFPPLFKWTQFLGPSNTTFSPGPLGIGWLQTSAIANLVLPPYSSFDLSALPSPAPILSINFLMFLRSNVVSVFQAGF